MTNPTRAEKLIKALQRGRRRPSRRAMSEALLLIGGFGCENFTRSHCEANGRLEGADFTADAWCDACIANAALGRPRGREFYQLGVQS